MSPNATRHSYDDDTSPEALRMQFTLLRGMSAARKLALMDQLTAAARAMTREGLRCRHPEATQAELDERFADLVLGRELAERVREYRRRTSPRTQA